jgi:chromosome partitioning protein
VQNREQRTVIIARLNQKGGVGKTTLALRLAGQSARQGKRITLIDAGPEGSELDWSEQRARRRLDRLFGVISLARDTLHRETPELTLFAADLTPIPAQLSPFDGWAFPDSDGGRS